MTTTSFRSAVLTLFIIMWLPPAIVRGAGYEFEGVGSRQVARGGAAVADVDDWTAIYWNPGGVARAAQAHREVGVELFAGFAYGKDSNSLSNLPGVGAVFTREKLSSPFLLGAIGSALPIGDRGGIGFGFYTPLLQGSDFTDTSANGVSLDFEGSAGILVWNVSGAFNFNPQFSAGAGVDLLYGKIKSDSTFQNFPAPTNTLSTGLSGDGFGLEGIFGVRFDPNSTWSLGAVYRTGSDVTVEGDAHVDNSLTFLPDEASDFEFELRHPATAGVGVAYRPNSKWIHSLDYNQTFWERFSNATDYETPGMFLTDTPNTFRWEETWKVRAGTRYKKSERTELLAGLAYDQPALDAGSIDLSTAIDVYMHRLTLGIARRHSEKSESIFGLVAGYGERTEGNVHYRLSGWQIMYESRFTL